MTDSIIQTRMEEQFDEHIVANLDYWMQQLARLCAVPSVSAQGMGIEECADLVATMLQEQGFDSQVMATDGHPIVVGKGDGVADRTLLFYLHYDVQPAEPLDLWDSPPFTLERRKDHLFARGVIDDKGHIICRLAALAAVRDVLGELPCNVKFIIEGEEEMGSPSIDAFITQNHELLAADACIWEFGGVDNAGRPAQTLGMRGLCYVELEATTASQDTHSGLGGSIFPNAAWRLVWALNTLKDSNERILIPGFYDDVVPPSDLDMALLAALPDEREHWLSFYGLSGFLNGMDDHVDLRRTAVFDPTCTICGLDSGYQGPGPKTVLPAKARAKVDFRLVPEQRPEDIVAKLRAHLDEGGFQDIEVTQLGGVLPARVAPNHPFVLLANQAAEDVYGMPPSIEPIIGGSGPNYPFIHELGLPVVSAGVGYPEGAAHAPNENMRLADFVQGTRHTARIISRFAKSEA